jgi:2-keto-4-pentenoate hydratase
MTDSIEKAVERVKALAAWLAAGDNPSGPHPYRPSMDTDGEIAADLRTLLAAYEEARSDYFRRHNEAIDLVEELIVARLDRDAWKAKAELFAENAKNSGYVLVPVEPTRQMWVAAGDAVVSLQTRNIGHHDRISEAVWEAMVQAALSHKEGAER